MCALVDLFQLVQGAINGKDAVVVQRRGRELTGQREADVNAVALVGLPCPHIVDHHAAHGTGGVAEERLARERGAELRHARKALVHQHGGREVGQV